MELSYKSYLATRFLKLLHGTVVQNVPFDAIFAGSCVALSCKSCLLKLFLKHLFGTVVQKLSCEVTSRGKLLIGIPGSSNGRGLWCSLSDARCSEIRLFMTLDGSVVDKLPFATASSPCMEPSCKTIS